MKQPADRGLTQSIKQRLLNLSRQTNETYNTLLVRFAVERLLYRLSVSRHNEDFVLKGAMLFAAWTSTPHRSTRDVDFLGTGISSAGRIAEAFREICSLTVPEDGLTFDLSNLTVRPIREDNSHDGLRALIPVRLGTARIPLQVDVGFGDSVVPAAQWLEFRAMLDLPSPRVRTYPAETVIAEKFDAMLARGMSNSRLKDYLDLAVLSRTMRFSRATLREAIAATLAKRGHEIPDELPTGLTDAFWLDHSKQVQWLAFLRKTSSRDRSALSDVVAELRVFFAPLLGAAKDGDEHWTPGSGWH